MEIQFLFIENNSMSTSFGKKLVTLLVTTKNVKTCGQCMSLMDKKWILFFSISLFWSIAGNSRVACASDLHIVKIPSDSTLKSLASRSVDTSTARKIVERRENGGDGRGRREERELPNPACSCGNHKDSNWFHLPNKHCLLFCHSVRGSRESFIPEWWFSHG